MVLASLKSILSLMSLPSLCSFLTAAQKYRMAAHELIFLTLIVSFSTICPNLLIILL